jgi:hypothetical protein
MTPRDKNDDGSTRVVGDDSSPAAARHGRTDMPPSGTRAGSDVTNRMAGTDRDQSTDRERDMSMDRDRDTTRMAGTDRDRDMEQDTTMRHEEDVEQRLVPAKYKPAKTSAAATFALVFGLAALFCALTAILSPAAVVFGIIGIILGIAGIKMAKKTGVTGKGVAIGGLVTAILGLLLGGAVLAGAAAVVNDPARLDQLENFLDDARENAPSTGELRDEIPTG